LPNLKQGPWTDLYALASVMFFAINGSPPAQAVARIVVDPVRPLAETAAGSYSDGFLAALDAAMAVKPEDRPQSIAEFRKALGFGGLLRDQPALRTGAPGMTGSAARPQTATRAESVPRTSAPTTASTSAPATVMTGLGETGDIERLLARYIGPMAKIIARRARAEAPDDEGLLRRVAEAIDDAGDRAEFLAAARRLKSH
jgi:hypothetical protein